MLNGDRFYPITPGVTTPAKFLKEYGLSGVLFREKQIIDPDKPMLERELNPGVTEFTIENEKCMHIDCIVRIDQADPLQFLSFKATGQSSMSIAGLFLSKILKRNLALVQVSL